MVSLLKGSKSLKNDYFAIVSDLICTELNEQVGQTVVAWCYGTRSYGDGRTDMHTDESLNWKKHFELSEDFCLWFRFN